jgi:hypothetical protein
MKSYIATGISPGMTLHRRWNWLVEVVNPSEIPMDAISIIGHLEACRRISKSLHRVIKINRSSINFLTYGDVVYVVKGRDGRRASSDKSFTNGLRVYKFTLRMELSDEP